MRFVSVISLLLSGSAAAANLSGIQLARQHLQNLASKQHRGPKELKTATSQRTAILKPQFLNDNTTKFAVNGTGLPDVDFDIGESYAGSLPISGEKDEQSNLFFWFFPTTNKTPTKEIVIWLNGGPGCSSFAGLLQENGPFLWQKGTHKPVRNPWAWNTLTHIIWVEQPVGTGFSTGSITVRSEEDVAAQFNGFWKNFVDIFGLHGYKVYVTGESYAGLYCPYIASAMLDANDAAYFDVAGLMIYDPVISEIKTQAYLPVVQFVDYWYGLFPFNDTFRTQIHAQDKTCGFSSYVNEYLVYPPHALQPSATKLPGYNKYDCEMLFYAILDAAMDLNPCFNTYHITSSCPFPLDVLGFPGSQPFTTEDVQVYFDREEVKKAIHAPADVEWELCTPHGVFVWSSDESEPSIMSALPHVIDSTKNVIIAHGALDMVLLANGTLLAIQNMTWGGKLGFQDRPTEPFYVPANNIITGTGTVAGMGVFGTVHSERGLTYVGVSLAGHEVPQYAPSAAFRQLEFLLGRVSCLNCTVPFTTDPNAPDQSKGSLGNGTAPPAWSDEDCRK